jgi:hypothetical protein
MTTNNYMTAPQTISTKKTEEKNYQILIKYDQYNVFSTYYSW